ncbi:MAG: hypothetical protein ACR2PZ_17410 [Pseudomonadales bacterium]
MAHANAVDEALVLQLEQASGREQLDLARKIEKLLQDNPSNSVTQQRLITVVTHSANLAKYGLVRMLHYLGPGAELDQATIIAVAEGMAYQTQHNLNGANYLSRLLIDYEAAKQLPEEAMANVYKAVSGPSPVNPAYAIHVLQAIPTTDERYLENSRSLVQALRTGATYVRENAAGALLIYGSKSQLPAMAKAALTESALNDSHIHIRNAAFAALAGQAGIDRDALIAAYARELTSPASEVWKASAGLSGQHENQPRALTLLMKFVAAPYSEAVIDALITQTARHSAITMPYLQHIDQTDGLSRSQRESLNTIAARHRQAEARAAIYQLLQGSAQPEPLADVLEAFESNRSLKAQLKAGYNLDRRYQNKPMPVPVLEAAERVMQASKHRELRDIAAGLLARSELEPELLEQKLLGAIREHSSDQGALNAWMNLYGDERVEHLTTQYVGDSSLSPWVRYTIVNRLRDLAEPGQELQRSTRKALVRVGSTTDSYALNSYIVTALQAWGAEVPLSIWLNNKSFQGTALFVIYVVLALVFIACSLTSLILTAKLPLRNRTRTAKRAGLVVLWLILSIALLGLFVLAFVGFLGHNSAPDPTHTFKLNVPVYIGMLVFLIYSGAIVAVYRRRSRG